MRRLTHALLALAGVIMGTGVAIAAPVLHLSGWKASAGKPETFTITRVGGNGPATVTFRTTDGTAVAPLDYTAAAQTISWRNGQTTLAITVPTFVDMAKAGTNIAFTATISSASGTSSATGLIVEPPAPAAPPQTSSACPSAGGVTLACETPIADTFDTNLGLEQSFEANGVRGGIPPVSPDPVGAFRFFCSPGQVALIDPLVNPGGVSSHLHQFWGNTLITKDSTYQTMRATGGSTCDNRSSPATAINHTGYWAPAMLDGAGSVVLPDMINTYYKQLPHGDPACTGPPDFTHQGWCVDLPAGIRFVFGWNPTTMKGGPNDPTGDSYYNIWFQCWSDLIGTPTTSGATANDYHSIAEVVAAGCKAGDVLVAQGVIPVCWDGDHLDSPDHRSHIVSYMPDTANGIRCPTDHPYVLPSAQFRLEYTTDANFTAGKWHLSSDEMMPGAPAGSTLHFDYMEAWGPAAKDAWFRNCIDKHLTCANGDLGNGMEMKEAGFPLMNGGVYRPGLDTDRHRLVPVPTP